MRRSTWLVLGSASLMAWAAGCGGSSNTNFSGSGGSAASGGSAGSGVGGTSGSGGSATGGSSGSGAGGNGGSAGSGTGGSGTGGSGTGGSGGAATGGSGGAATGGSGGSATGGSGGAATGGSGGSGGSATGGTGGAATGGTGGTATGGTGGADACVPAKWCHDEDNDGYGNPTSTVTSCTSPGAQWIEAGSKQRACEDCNDANNLVHPFSNHCDGKGYALDNGGVSFDFNCDGNETECGTTQKADPNGCHVSSGGATTCAGSGYLPTKRTGTNQNPYCGSTSYRQCTPGPGGCAATVHNDYNPVTCK